MTLPYSRNQTYVAGTTPIAAADMNDLQDWTTATWEALSGDAFHLSDDFTGTSIDLTKWLQAGNNPTRLSIVSRTGAAGALRFLATTDTDDAYLSTVASKFGTVDFHFAARVEVVVKSASTAVDYCGIVAGGAANAYFYVAGTGNWFAYCASTAHDTGVAATGSGTFQVLQIRRASGTVSFLIDGVEVYSEAVSMDFTVAAGSVVTVKCARDGAGNTEVYFDYVKFWCAR